VADPAGQIAVAGLILTMDLADAEENPDFNKLRRSLGLPVLDPIDPEGVRVTTLTPAQQTRLIVGKLADDDLVTAFRRATMIGSARLIRRIAQEVVSRPSLDNHPEVSKAEVYDILSRIAPDADEALALVLKAQEIAKVKGQSPARYLLAEFTLRLRRGEEAEAKRVLNTLMSKHMREPGIQQSVYSILAQLGLIEIDPTTGQPVMARGMAAAPAAAPAGGLWTPDQGMPTVPAPAAPAASKSKLWVPGMD
jgi:hypothetical protein